MHNRGFFFSLLGLLFRIIHWSKNFCLAQIWFKRSWLFTFVGVMYAVHLVLFAFQIFTLHSSANPVSSSNTSCLILFIPGYQATGCSNGDIPTPNYLWPHYQVSCPGVFQPSPLLSTHNDRCLVSTRLIPGVTKWRHSVWAVLSWELFCSRKGVFHFSSLISILLYPEFP